MIIPKFRAWHKKSRVLFPVFGIQGLGAPSETGGTLIFVRAGKAGEYAVEMWYEEDVELMQYTGFQSWDEDIYEGDIYKSDWDEPRIGCIKRQPGGNWVFDMGDSFMNLYDENLYNLHLIGNIYENPELLRSMK